jgi:flagellar biosynthetic protein FlhB
VADAPSEERTEQATQKRMKEVRQKGKLSKSQDLTAWASVGAAAILLPLTIGNGTDAAVKQMFNIASITQHPTAGGALQALGDGLGSVLPTLTMLFVAVVVTTVAASAVQGGIHVKKFEAKFEHFNLISGLKRTFGMQALWNGAKSLLKTGVVGLALFMVIQSLMPVLSAAGNHTIAQLISQSSAAVTALMQTAIIAGLLLAAVDVFVVMFRNRKQTRMTKKEVKDENKNTDGDPLIKSQRRSRQMALSRSRMMGAIIDADVVLINPTHFAVALKYEPGKGAPRVVAKGSGHVAARMRAKAEEVNVPMVEDIPLTRALHAACQLGQEIPHDFYNTIAHVLTFVRALKHRGRARGVHKLPKSVPALGGR